ncbi:hypothetical protein HK101_010624 [Irineochytrium annulatum]|nr:hypothetical protein HK101_010624 [Irineochytrium annulatum]
MDKKVAVAKVSYRVQRLKDGTLLVENPYRIKKNGQEPSEVLVVKKDQGGIQVLDRKAALPSNDLVHSSVDIFAIIGIIDLCFGKYLLVATQRALACTIQSHKVWRVTAGVAIPVGSSIDVQLVKAKETMDEHSLAQFTLDQELLSNINGIINSHHLYYSTTYDITHSVQHNFLKSTSKASTTVIDDRYFFNGKVQEPFLASANHTGDGTDSSPWIYKMICGFGGAIDISLKNPTLPENTPAQTYTVALLSRLNHRRLGTRYVRRGLDWDGNAANNVEMEQIVFHHDFAKYQGITAFCQVRGSAPAVWGQELNLDYRPELLIADTDKPDVWRSIGMHYTDLKKQYIGESAIDNGNDHGKVVCVNLLDDKGFEKQLTKTYEETVRRFGDSKVQYEEFPVNKWCKKMNFRNMDILVDRMRDRLINSGWFVAEGDVPALENNTYVVSSSRPLKAFRLQTGIARVSCLDSLDRTNLTCSIFARYVIPYQIRALGSGAGGKDLASLSSGVSAVDGASPGDIRDPVATLRSAVEPSVRVLTNLWADSGDAVSLLYAGTRALKSDVTRTGKRQWLRGSLDDGLNSLTRYYLNNFSDGRKQDGYDLWTGKVTAEQMRALAETEGARKAKQIQKPFLEKGKGITGFFLPGFVIDRVEPLLQAASEFATSTMEDQVKKAQKLQEAASSHFAVNGDVKVEGASPNGTVFAQPPSYISFLVSAIKIYAPEQVSNVLEFVVAMVVFFYILVLVKIFQIKGQTVVDRPKLSYEYATIHEVLD